MSTGDKKPFPDDELPGPFYPAPPVHHTAPPPVAGPRGCLFYGCVFASSVALVLLLALGIGLLVLYQYRGEIVERFTSPESAPIPVVELPQNELDTLEQRLEDFEHAASRNQLDRLTLTEAQINGLIASNPEIRGKIAVRLEKDRIRALVSFPLEELRLPAELLGNLGGRYLNGTAIIDPKLEGDVLILSIRQLEVQGSNVPFSILDRLVANHSIAFKLNEDGSGRPDLVNRISSFKITEGQLTVELLPPPVETGSPLTTPPPAPQATPPRPPDSAAPL